MMIALPTVHGALFVLAAVISLGVAYVNVGLATALVASFFSAVTLASFLMAQFSLYRIRLEREPMMDTSCNTNTNLPLRVINNSPFSRQSMTVCEKGGLVPEGKLNVAVRSLKPHESLFLPRPVRVVHRGHYSLNRIVLYGGDPAGIFRRRRVFHLPGDILVAPQTVEIESLPLHRNRKVMPGQEGRPLSIAGIGKDFFGVRPYRHGDEMRFIHWKSTASKRQLMVKEMEAQTVDRVAIVLDTNRSAVGISEYENNFEFLASVAATIVEYLGSIFCYLSFYIRMEDRVVELHGDATGIKGKILSLLTEVRPSDSDYAELMSGILEQLEPGTVLYALSLSSTPSLVDALELLLEQHVHIHWIYAPMQNFPHVDPETPMVLNPARISVDRSRQILPYVVSCRSEIREVLTQC